MSERDDVEVQATRAAELAGAAIERGTGSKDVIDKDVMLTGGYGHPLRQCKGIFEIGPPGLPIVGRLRLRVHDPAQQRTDLGITIHRSDKDFRQYLTLVKLPITGLSGVQGHRDQDGAAEKGSHMLIAPHDGLKIPRHVETVVVFQLNDQRPDRAQEKGHRAPFPEGGVQPDAMRAHPLALDFPKERMPAGQAVRLMYSGDQAGTEAAQMP